MNDQPISDFETPQHYLATHPITLELMQRGVTEEHLAAIRFRPSNRERPFDQWSFTWGNGMPAEAIPFAMPYSRNPQELIDAVAYGLRASPIPNVAEAPAPDCVILEMATGHIQYAAVAWMLRPKRSTFR